MDLIKFLREQREAKQAELDALVKVPTDEKRSLTEAEDASFDALGAELRALDARIEDMVDLDKRQKEADEARKAAGITNAVVNESNPVYRKDDNAGASFFRDLAISSKPNHAGFDESRRRLTASQETRAIDLTTSAGAGGEFAPPLWLVEDFVSLARAGRVTADLTNHMTLPSGVSSVNLPKVAAGTTVAVQQTQGNAVSDTALTTTSVTSGITTLAGKQTSSLQLLEQSGVPIDRVILQDLAKAYAVQIDTQVLYGTNANGQLNGLVNTTNTTAFTTASPAPASSTQANSLYYAVSKAQAAIWSSIFQPANCIVMTPRRWAWILGSVDANSRPLVIPTGHEQNPIGTGGPAPQGLVGTFGGLPVYVDPNISTTANSTTNQDEIYVLRSDELWLWESDVQSASFDATFADSLQILYRVHGYAAFIPNRYTGAIQAIRGTGLVAP